MNDTQVTSEDVARALRQMGVRAGHTVMAHSSYKSFGGVEGGPEAVIDGLLAAVGPRGHVVMPSLAATYVRAGKHDMGQVWHPAKTPSRVGIITDLFWRRPGAVRSAHPTHALACIGPHAAAWMQHHESTTFGGWDGPYANYIRSGGAPSWIVFLGVTPVCNTTLHAVEEWLGLPYMAESKAMAEVDGVAQEVTVTQAPLGPRGFYKIEDRYHQLMEQTGLFRRAVCGQAAFTAIDARACIRETVRLELENPGILLKSDPNCEFSLKGRAALATIQPVIRSNADEIRRRVLSA